MSDRFLLDASAVLALLGREPGAEKVQALLASSAIAAVNLAEVIKKLREHGVPREIVETVIRDLNLPLEAGPASAEQAFQVGEMAVVGRTFGLSLGDAVCLATASWTGRTAVTAERAWLNVAEHSPGNRVVLIR